MGARSSKVIITPETKPPANTPEPTTKEVFRNGNTEAIPSIDEVATEPNGDYTSLADETNTTLPAVDECPNSKQKKKNPVNWIQKKISVKKIKTPKKAPTCKETAATEAESITEDTEKTKEQPIAAVAPPVGDTQTQVEEVTKVDQSTEKSELPAAADISTAEPVVEIVPTENYITRQEGDEHFVAERGADEQEEALKYAEVPVEMTEQGNVEEETVAESAQDESNTSALAEKLASLEIDSTQSAIVETDEAVVTNGDVD